MNKLLTLLALLCLSLSASAQGNPCDYWGTKQTACESRQLTEQLRSLQSHNHDAIYALMMMDPQMALALSVLPERHCQYIRLGTLLTKVDPNCVQTGKSAIQRALDLGAKGER